MENLLYTIQGFWLKMHDNAADFFNFMTTDFGLGDITFNLVDLMGGIGIFGMTAFLLAKAVLD